MQRPHRLFVGSPECGEVVPALERFCRRDHRRYVKRFPDAERVALTQRTIWTVPDDVAVFAPLRSVAWLEATIHLAQPTKTDVRRYEPTKRSLQLIRTQLAAVGESDHLLTGVDTGVCSTGAIDSDAGITRKPSQSAFQRSLDRPGTCLHLEAGKVSSVVFDPCAVTNGAALSGALSGARLFDGRWLSGQTSSSWTMGAASPARAPIFTIRV
jgi:hypothetical protein